MRILRVLVFNAVMIVSLAVRVEPLQFVGYIGADLAFASNSLTAEKTKQSVRVIDKKDFKNLMSDIETSIGGILVKFKDNADSEQIKNAKERAGVDATTQLIGPTNRKNIHIVKLKTNMTLENALRSLRSSESVVYAEPNHRVKAQYIPSDTGFTAQWGLYDPLGDNDINAPEAWDIETGITNPINVAVIDTGVDMSHPDLESKILQTGYNWAGISQGYISNWMWFGDTEDNRYFAQSFKGTGQLLSHIGILLKKYGSPSSDMNISVSVRTSPDGSDLASFTITPDEVSGTQITEIYKELSPNIMLQSEAKYYLVFNTTDVDSLNCYKIYDNDSSYSYDQYREGEELYRSSGVWYTFTGDDFYFRTNPNSYPHDDNGHGTHVGGIIGAESDNAQGIAGVSFGAKLMPLKVLDSSGNGFESDCIDAIYYAVDNGCQVINLSLVGATYLQSEQDAVNYAHNHGVVVFASVGNDGNKTTNYPAGCSNVIGVGALNKLGLGASFSNYNSSVDLCAPGIGVYSTMPTYDVNLSEWYMQDYDRLSGTSMACPFAAGVGALLLSKHPTLTPDEVEACLESTTKDLGPVGRDDKYGYGLVNAYNGLRCLCVSPKIDSLSPSSGYIGTSVTISGTNFGSYQGTSSAAFNSTIASVSSWSDTSIVCTVPSGATTGDVVVTKAYGVSNGMLFTVNSCGCDNRYEQTDAHVSWTGLWTSITDTGASGGSRRYSNDTTTPGSCVFTFTGTCIKWIGTKAYNRGKSQILIDDSPVATVDIFSSSVQKQQVLYESCSLKDGAHTIKIIATKNKNPLSSGYYTDVDEFEAMGVPTIPVISTISPTSGSLGDSVTITGTGFYERQCPIGYVSFNGTKVAETGILSWSDTQIVAKVPTGATTGPVKVAIGGLVSNGVVFTIGGGCTLIRYEQTDSHVSWTGLWTNILDTGASGGSRKYSNDKITPATCTFQFSGNCIRWIGTKANNRGKSEIWIDGTQVTTVDLYSSSVQRQQMLYENSSLAPGSHTITIKATSSKNPASTGFYSDVDALEVAGL